LALSEGSTTRSVESKLANKTNGSGAERYNAPRPPDALPETDLMRRSGLGTCGLPFAADRAIVRSG
jgi:hypothetical protein